MEYIFSVATIILHFLNEWPLLAIVVYFLPLFIAITKQHPYQLRIVFINLLIYPVVMVMFKGIWNVFDGGAGNFLTVILVGSVVYGGGAVMLIISWGMILMWSLAKDKIKS